MSIEWQNLRDLDGSQNKAFEELCCQLAGAEKTISGSSFRRKASPDAGVECYWKLPDGSEWGWQAKFFPSPPIKGQWQQIDDSLKTALDKHPNLSKYTVCLPIDRSDPRIDGQSSFMSEWDKHVTKWEEWAQSKKMAVTFDYWGAHELFERLSREEHKGRYYFWFNRELFSRDWFQNRIEEAIANVGPRYTPELDVKLPIAHLFDGLGKTQEFAKRVRKLQRTIQELSRPRLIEDTIPELEQLHLTLDQLWAVLETVDDSPSMLIDWEKAVDLTQRAVTQAHHSSEKISALSETLKSKKDSEKRSGEYDRGRT